MGGRPAARQQMAHTAIYAEAFVRPRQTVEGDDVVQFEERVVGVDGLLSNTSSPAPAMRCSCRAWVSACPSTVGLAH